LLEFGLLCVRRDVREVPINYTPTGVSATPSWTRWSDVSIKENKYGTVRTHLKNFTLLFPEQAVVFDAYNLPIRESMVAAALVKARGDLSHTSCTDMRVKQFTGVYLRFSVKIG
jgi:hypothetical protein